MATPTKKEIRDRLAALAIDATAPPALKELATNLTENDRNVGGTTATTAAKLTRFNSYLSGADATLVLAPVQQIVSWLTRHVVEADDPAADPALVTAITTMKARLKQLERSATATDDVKAFLQQILERSPAVGHDDDTVLTRLQTELAKPANSVDPTRLERLMDRARNAWETLADG